MIEIKSNADILNDHIAVVIKTSRRCNNVSRTFCIYKAYVP